jgi:hypothetical protein
VWSGILPEFTGRPGTSQLCNKKRTFDVAPEFVEEESRAYSFFKILQLTKGIEEDMPLTVPNGQDTKTVSKTS